MLVEDAFIGIQQAADAEGIVVLVEQLLQPSEGEVIMEAIVNVVRGIHEVLDEYRLQHV